MTHIYIFFSQIFATFVYESFNFFLNPGLIRCYAFKNM